MNFVNRLAQVFDTPQTIPHVTAGQSTIASVLSVVFTIAGAVAVVVITLAGFEYVLSQGDSKRTAKAKDTILYALIGLVVAISGYAIVNFVIKKVFF